MNMKWDLLWVVWDLIGIYFLQIGKKMYSFLEMPAKIYIQSRPNLLEFSALKPKSYNQSIDNINLPNLHALFFIASVVDRTGPDLPDLPDRFGIRFGLVRFGIFLKYQTGLF